MIVVTMIVLLVLPSVYSSSACTHKQYSIIAPFARFIFSLVETALM